MDGRKKERKKQKEHQRRKSMKKCSRRGPKMKKQSRKLESGGRKMQENGDWGCLQEATKHENAKKTGPFNSVAPFLMIWEENGSQDGGQNP